MSDTSLPVILTIDDESSLRESFRDYLEDYNYQVLEAENGRIGLEVFAREKVDLILVDLRMPEMDGLEVLTEIKNKSPDTPVIVVSGTGVIGDAVGALHHGAWDYLLKPIEDMSVLLHAVEKGLEKSQLIRENKIYQTQLEELVDQKTIELRASNEELNQINRRLREIVATTTTLTGCGELLDCGSQLLKEFAKNMGAEGGSLYFVEENGLQLAHSLDPGHAPPWIPKPLPEKSLFAMALAQDKPLFYTHFNSENDLSYSGWQGYNDHSLLIFQLHNRDNTVSALIALHSKNNPPFIPQDREIGSILASYTCEVLQTAQANEALRKSEERLRQAQKMEAIGTLAGGIAHDFNNILAAVMGYTELALLEPDDMTIVRQHLSQIQKAGNRAKDLVSQILTFSRKHENEFNALDISPIIKEGLKLIRASLPSTINIVQEIPSGLGKIMADPTQIHQIIMNLCTNSAHAMQEHGGTLSIQLRREEKCESQKNHSLHSSPCLHLTVSDTGHGMSPKVIERIFEPYFTTKERGEGTGLGLSVIHGIISSTGGNIEVNSAVGQQTTFHLYFPIIEGKEEHDETILVTPLPTGCEHILFVDDEESLVGMADHLLSGLGYHVTALTSSVEALALFRTTPHKFDIVITDQTMPQIPGSEMAVQMLNIRPNLPIILCTGFSTAIDEKKAKSIGIKEFIMKPWGMSPLANTVRQLLDKTLNDRGS